MVTFIFIFIFVFRRITTKASTASEALPGYEEAQPMVFCGMFPTDADDFQNLRDALGKLQLNDAALQFEPEVSSAMGFGFRCGFLGLLHMDVVQERLEREFDMDLVITAPTVVYRCIMNDGEVLVVRNPSELPDASGRSAIEEPYCRLEMITPKDYVGPLMELANGRRGEMINMQVRTQARRR